MEELSSKVTVFLTYCKISKNLSSNTIKGYRQDLRSYIKFLDQYPDSTPMDYVSHLAESRHKTSTIKRHLATLKQFYEFIYKDNRRANPMLEFEFRLKSEKCLPRTIATRDIKKLLSELEKIKNEPLSSFQKFQTTRNIALLDLLCATGIRIGEAAAIKIEDIDLRSRIILIHGKGRKERLIYLSCQETVDNIREWLSLRKQYSIRHTYLFVNRSLSPISIHAIEDIFYKYRNLAKINPKATPHFLRHTFATNLLANGADLRSVQEILGHSNISITERYTEVTTTRKIKVLKKYNYRNSL